LDHACPRQTVHPVPRICACSAGSLPLVHLAINPRGRHPFGPWSIFDHCTVILSSVKSITSMNLTRLFQGSTVIVSGSTVEMRHYGHGNVIRTNRLWAVSAFSRLATECPTSFWRDVITISHIFPTFSQSIPGKDCNTSSILNNGRFDTFGLSPLLDHRATIAVTKIIHVTSYTSRYFHGSGILLVLDGNW